MLPVTNNRYNISEIFQIIIIIAMIFMPMASVFAEDQALAGLFAQRNVEGAVVISSLKSGKIFIHNDSRASHRFSPASTFKILNTLIVIDEKVVSGKDDAIKWDGQFHTIADWNHDQTLESAFKVSCVWCYQAMARKIGVTKYNSYLEGVEYGVSTQPFDEMEFWLDGSLRISAIEQVAFLRKIHQESLPFSAVAYETLRQIMLVSKTPAFSLWAKTGWVTRIKPSVGWYVGYVETKRDVWFFALNIDVSNEKDLPLRKNLVMESLQVKGIIE